METECVLSLGDQRWTLPPGTDTITLGRASNADIRLQADDQISRIHARLTRDGDTWYLHDESRNGTGLNGHRLTAPTPLTQGDQIHIGRSVLTFHTPAPTAAITAPPPTGSHAAPPAGAPVAEPPAPTPSASHAASPPAPTAEPPRADPTPAAPPQAPFPAAPAPADSPWTADAPPAPPADAAAQHPAGAPHDGQPEAYPVVGSPFAPDARDNEPAYEDGLAYNEREYAADEREYAVDERVNQGQEYEPDDGYGAAGVVPGFESARAGDGGTWAAYPSADNPEPVRSPWEISAQIDQSEPNWNESDGWPAAPDRRTGTDRRSGDRRAPADRRTPADRRATDRDTSDRRGAGSTRLPNRSDDRGTSDLDGEGVVGTVRLPRVLIAAGAVIVLGLIVNLIVTFLSAGPSGDLRWLVPPGIALVVAMILALLDAAAPKHHRPGRFDVSVLIAIAVVLVGIGVGGFALTAGAEYVAGYLTGNESGADRLVKPVAKAGSGITMTVENVTYTSHFTRIEVLVANGGKEAFSIPIDGTTFTAADGTALHADSGKSAWPSRIAAGGSEHGTITFKGHLPDSATAAVLTFKSGSTSFAVNGIQLSK
ncbi:FHA domain-containing protein [Kribbella sp. NPDC048928]|uniref:FHA domain-containing protein n=1 Tax=Kribbella sp. NPDC048928 TaxID=3364111 RepID=UPI00371E4E76